MADSYSDGVLVKGSRTITVTGKGTFICPAFEVRQPIKEVKSYDEGGAPRAAAAQKDFMEGTLTAQVLGAINVAANILAFGDEFTTDVEGENVTFWIKEAPPVPPQSQDNETVQQCAFQRKMNPESGGGS